VHTNGNAPMTIGAVYIAGQNAGEFAIVPTSNPSVLAPGASFEVAFDKPGSYRYHCTIHRFMQGEVDVFAVALTGPEHSVPLGSNVTLTGLAAPDAGSVTLEQQQGDGSYAGVASTGVGGDGAFSFPIAVAAPATFQL